MLYITFYIEHYLLPKAKRDEFSLLRFPVKSACQTPNHFDPCIILEPDTFLLKVLETLGEKSDVERTIHEVVPWDYWHFSIENN